MADTKKKKIFSSFCNFCQQTSIHGLSGMTDLEKPFIYRIIWMIVTIMSFVGAGYIIYGSWLGY
jgi:hypothetical protein